MRLFKTSIIRKIFFVAGINYINFYNLCQFFQP